MTEPTPQQRNKTLILVTSILSGLQTLVAAGSLADVVGSKLAALLVVIVAAAQVGVHTYIAQTIGQTVNRVSTTVTTTKTGDV